MLTTNETIETLKAAPKTSPNLDGGGNDGGGKLETITNQIHFITFITTTIHYKIKCPHHNIIKSPPPDIHLCTNICIKKMHFL